MVAGSGFELVCARDEWVGLGRYSREGDRLRFTFTALTRKGEVVKRPEPVEFVFSGRGNEMALRLPNGSREWVWQRILPSQDSDL